MAGNGHFAARLGTFVEELRRRRVFRVVVAYGIAAFAVLQVAEPVLHGLRLPDWTLTVIVVLLGLGLPVSIALAWIYDLTTEGVQRTVAAPPHPAQRHHGLLLGVMLVASAVIAGGIAVLALRPSLPAVDEQGRLVVAVADFDNETADPELNGLSGMLITSLEQSRRLAVLTRSRMLDVLRRAGGPAIERVDENLGREVARQAGARVLVTAAVHRFDEIYAIELKVVDPARAAYLFTLAERGRGKSSVPEMIDRLSERIRLRLRESEGEVQSSRVRVGEALTARIDAYEHYFRGVQQQEASRYEAAIVEYRKAVAIDPAFPLAHYRIAYAGFFGSLTPAVIADEIALAMRDVDRVPEKERLLIRAWNEHLGGREDEAKALYARAAAAWPDDKQVSFMAGEHLIHWGRIAESLPYFEQAVALDPTWEWARFHVVDALLFEGRLGDALTRSREWAREKPDGDTLKWLSRAQLANGRCEEAEASARRAVEFSDHGGATFAPYWARFALIDALICEERYGDAESILRPMATPAVPPSDRVRALAVLAEVLSYQGRRAEALRTIDLMTGEGATAVRRLGLRMTHLATARDGGVRHDAGEAARRGVPGEQLATLLALAGDFEAAEQYAARASVASPERLLHDAVAAWRRREFDGARSRFAALTARREADYASFARLALAEIAVAEARPADAVPLLETYGRTPAIALRWGAVPPEIFRSYSADYFRAWGYPRSLYLLALADHQLGNTSRARVELDHLLALWKHADPDQPLFAEALALRRRLGGRSNPPG